MPSPQLPPRPLLLRLGRRWVFLGWLIIEQITLDH